MLNTTYPMNLTPRSLNGVEVPTGWQAQNALASEAAEADGHLDAAGWRTLLAAIANGLPVVIVYRERDGKRRKVTARVEYAVVHPEANVSARMRLSYWGFGHDVYVSDIESVATPDVEFLD
ncbi:hypothetical protein I5H03_gp068 [Mycobacterium phage Nibb]|uniref:Uncharacterized protein n=1 Tax=Mycobacterium phage Nibb TaxID=2510585 RepID=A0A411B5I0_9CAUD|nr:hypothetical protein I5H03_gp068 [Mycobacterium phage Nibb]QAX95578.1 hypothetical protein SEA_NIBB_39 [Mycobacterium phage Nibb]